jgi:uncharacterized protein (DUF433 family)
MSDEPVIRPNRNGVPAINGTRLTVYSIMDRYFAGAGLREISDFYRITEQEAVSAMTELQSHRLLEEAEGRDAMSLDEAIEKRRRERSIARAAR